MDNEKEDLKDVGRSESRSEGNGAEANGAGEQGNGDTSGSSSGSEGGSEGGKGGGSRSEGGSPGSSEGSENSSGDSAKIDLLQRIRAQRTNGQRDSSSTEDGASAKHPEGNSKNSGGHKRGNADNHGPSSRNDRDNGRDSKQDDNSNSGISETSQTNDRNSRVKEKPQGVKVKGVDKIKELAQKAAQADPPKLKFTWDEKTLTNKEADEVLPKVKALLEFVFRHMDKGISISNRNRAQAHIWGAIDNEDIEIIASHLVEMGKASKVVATAVRRMTNSYRLLQIGLITLPKFIQTFQFYQSNGGFALMGGK